eukprot:g12795.t1
MVSERYGENERDMPWNSEGTETEGCVIATFTKPEDAAQAQQALDGMSLDKKHTFKVVKFDKFNDITNRASETCQEVCSLEFRPQRNLASYSRADFRSWLMDKKCREQFLLRYQTETEIYWHDTTIGEPALAYGGEREKRLGKIWCDWQVEWSPLGVALWAGPEFTKKIRFAHDGVKHLEFPVLSAAGVCFDLERYRCFGERLSSCENPSSAHWRMCAQVSHAHGPWQHLHDTAWSDSFSTSFQVAPLGGDFPHFLWSHDGKYFAECSESAISVRETASFELIRDEDGKKKTLKFPDLSTFQWSPKDERHCHFLFKDERHYPIFTPPFSPCEDNLLSVWCLERENNPARLVLVEIPSRRELASRSRTQVEASMHWQSEGDYLCLINTKLSKTKKKGATNLEIFRIREKNIPVDIVEVKDSVRGFHWETKGHRFALLTSDESGHHPKMFIYGLSKEKCEALSFFDLPSNSYNKFFWAPEGQYFVCAADEHFMLTDVQWDPSSRYVITAAGFAIWTFQGRVLHRQQKEKLWQIAWRPHPPCLLSQAKQSSIRKNVKQYSKKYDHLDDQAKEAARNAFKNERETKMSHFRKVLERLDDAKHQRSEENGWADAVERHLAGQGWEPVNVTTQEVIEAVEEKI